LFYSVTLVDGNLTVTESSSVDAVPSIDLPDQVDGHVYRITTVNGALTVTRIS